MMTDSGRLPRPGVIRPRLVVDDVYDQLVVLIVDGHVAPEEPLSIDALAREFGVSTSPVREALARLEATGLIRRMAMRGYRVAPALQASELRDLMEARLLIEPGAAARAASATPRAGTVAALDAAVEDLAKAPRGSSYESFREYYEADRRFHHAVVAGTGNRFIMQSYEALGGQFQRFRLFSGRGVTDADATIAEHAAVRDAIESGDARAAAAAMHAHLDGVTTRSLGELATAL
ncbi:GntR family transcriptional regulator [uncultured Microbacterium sp.]|uniref:GntR family transcriptional regulator n=1 Tax=uncultured Microbacterium sp. TaxID=191216 RepID=UPI0028D7BF81|nr:GntR family transcriptional regulator [uncultured Microbacterium sp.]